MGACNCIHNTVVKDQSMDNQRIKELSIILLIFSIITEKQ